MLAWLIFRGRTLQRFKVDPNGEVVGVIPDGSIHVGSHDGKSQIHWPEWPPAVSIEVRPHVSPVTIGKAIGEQAF